MNSQAQSRIVQIQWAEFRQVFKVYDLILNWSDHMQKKRIQREFTGVIETDLIYLYYKAISVSKENNSPLFSNTDRMSMLKLY